jgi:maltose/moltooligosaccharide transporter
MQQPRLSFWQIWNLSFGFLGVQFGFALQNANASRVLSDLGADLHSLSLFWLVAPITGLIIQPIVGAASDRTWNSLGRRRPYILGGAIAACIGMILMPNANLLVHFIPAIIFGGLMLALMDGAFNVTMQPFRALVTDMLPNEQRTLGYSMQSLLINIGSILGSLLPFLLTNIAGLSNSAEKGEVADTVIWAFYLGATVLLGSVLWSVIKTKEYSPIEYQQYKNIVVTHEKSSLSFSQKLAEFWNLFITMPKTMRQLALVQFFSWFSLFIMWVYTTPAITQHIWGIDKQWFDSQYLSTLSSIPPDISAAKGAAGDWTGILFASYSLFAALFSLCMAAIAKKIGRKLTYSLSLVAGGLGYISVLFFQNAEIVEANLLIAQVDIPRGALLLLLPMLGIGIAWAAILAMPYAILSSSLPPQKTGVYMGIFNFTIAAPQIVSGLLAGVLVKFVFDNRAIYAICLAGICMLLGAISVYFVREE